MDDCIELEGVFLQAKEVGVDDANHGTWNVKDNKNLQTKSCFENDNVSVFAE